MNKLLNILAIGGVFLGLLGVVQNASATNYFSWRAEGLSGVNAPQWDSKGASTGAAILRDLSSINCTVKHSGACSLKVQPTGNGTNESTGIDLNGIPPAYPWNFIGSPSLYFRWWMRIDKGFSWGNGSVYGNLGSAKTKSGRQNLSDLSAQWYTGAMFADGFRITECEETSGHAGGCLNADGTTGSDEGPIFVPYNVAGNADSQWHEYIVRIKPNTSASCTTPGTCDAQFEVWVDGVSVGSYNNFRLSNKNGSVLEWWGSWMTNPYWQLGSSVPAGGTVYLDDFSTDDTFNSIYSNSNGGDITPPTDVRIITPTAGATLSGKTNISGICTDETSIRGVQFKYGTTNIGSEDTLSPYSVSWDATAVPNGIYLLTAVCTDNGGNITTSSAQSATVSNTVSARECPSNWKTLHPTWIYCDDFETDKSNLYVDSNYYGSRMAQSSGNGLNSSYSLRATFPAAPGAASNGGDFTIAFGASPVSPTVDATDTAKYRELYWRAYIKTQAGWQPGTGQKLTRASSFHNSGWAQSMIAHWWGTSASPENTLQVDPASGVCRGGVYPAGSPSCSNNTVITTGWNDFPNLYWLGLSAGTVPVLGAARANTWQCIEGYVKLNDAGQSNGVQTLWVDGVQDATKTGINFVGTYSTYGINIFRLENYTNAGVSQSQYRDWDNLVLSTTRIGCSIDGASNLSAPTNLKVR